MTARINRLSGTEWQEWGNLLLSQHYGPADYQKIPDKQKGDAGLEGFSISKGHAYQSYGCEEPISTKDRYAKQRIKMTNDIEKFIKNNTIFQKILGSIKISRWALFVPYFDSKDIVQHASKMTEKVLEKRLSYVADDFRVVVLDEQAFQTERDKLIRITDDSISVAVDPVTMQEVTRWANQNNEKTTTLEDKIGRLYSLNTIEKKKEFRDRVLKWFLEGQELLNALRKFPDTYEKIIHAKSHRENYLASLCISEDGISSKIFSGAKSDILSTFSREVRELSPLNSDTLAHEALSDWLLRCPLDFPEIA